MANHSTPTERRAEPARLMRHLDAVAAARARRGLPAPQIQLRAPSGEVRFGDTAQRFHSASVGKMMTATLAFQLAEGGALDLDAPLPKLLPAGEWEGLFDVHGADHAPSVTPHHLLSHTSGVADYFEGPTDASRPFVAGIIAEPERRWTPDALLGYSRQHQRAVGEPGTRFAYSDTGYVLLARVVEEAGGASLASQLHERIFAPLGMDDTCLIFHTMPGGAGSPERPADALGLAPLWVGGAELSHSLSLSCDWGGGGVVTTVGDLAGFSEAWHRGELVGAASRDRMTSAHSRFRAGIHCGEGVMELRYGGFMPLLRGMPRSYGHLGVTGAHLFAVPAAGIHLAMNFHSTAEMGRSFRTHIRLMQHALRGL